MANTRKTKDGKTWKQTKAGWVELSDAESRIVANTSRGSKASPKASEEAELKSKIKEKKYQLSLPAKERALYDNAQEEGFGTKAAVNYINEIDQMAAGATDLGYTLKGMFPFGSDPFQTAQDQKDFRKERDEHNALVDPLMREAGPAALSSMPLYMSSGRYASKPFDAVAGKVIDYASAIPKKATKGAWDKISGGIKDYGGKKSTLTLDNSLPLIAAEGGAKRMSQEATKGFIDPVNRQLARMKERFPIQDPFFKGALKDVAGDTMLSTAESALHDQESAWEGAMAGVFGSGAGKALGPMFSKAPNINTQSTKDILDWAKDKGFRALPGMDTGQPKYQRFESDLRSDDKWSMHMKNFDAANDKVTTKIAGEAMGLDSKAMQDLTPEALAAHKADLKAQYENLQMNSVGRVDKKGMVDMGKDIANLPKNEQRVVREQMDKILKVINTKGRKDKVTGRFTGINFDGAEYQTIIQNLKTAYNTAYKNNNTASYKVLDKMIKKMDAGMELGVKEYGGTATASQWKDLNERWAMTDLIEKNGMNLLGGIDSNKLSRYLGSPDEISRTLHGTGGRIKELQKIAKLNFIQREQAGGGLNRLHAGDNDSFDPTSKKQGFMSTPMSLKLPLLGRAKVGLYTAGYPAKTGLLGLDPASNWRNPSKIGRAANQSTDLHSRGTKAAMGAKESFDEWYARVIEGEGEE